MLIATPMLALMLWAVFRDGRVRYPRTAAWVAAVGSTFAIGVDEIVRSYLGNRQLGPSATCSDQHAATTPS